MPVEPVEAEPAEVLPQEAAPKIAPKRLAEPSRKPVAGDLVCGECGEVNGPTRKFCLRCGEALTTAEVVRAKWWRRLFRRRGVKLVSADKRPTKATAGKGKRRVFEVRRKARVVIAVGITAFSLVAGFYPPLRSWIVDTVDGWRSKVDTALEKTYDPVRPAKVTASGEVPGHGPALLFDSFSNTYWAAPWSEDRQPITSADLGGTKALVKVVVHNGAGADFAKHPRASIVNLSYSNEKSDTIILKDTPDAQEFTLTNGLAASSVKIEVISVYPAEGNADVAIAEMEFFSAL
ncbi:hypothetical protein BJP25_19240 [Actinokineospora bangkokensis]|uniref:F5/8 type C domain-containing protein n=1 Tax=Actinokineospora bangkokensis TaxID=1193682 RepID=A0A1Q9LM61_9PSEU|nr:hypothetical protein BJP25_19240 [Actinokineospora bangkokensis]